MSISRFFQFPASREPVVLGAPKPQPKPQKFSKKRKRSNEPYPDLSNIHLTRGEGKSLFDHIRNINHQPKPQKFSKKRNRSDDHIRNINHQPRPTIGFVEPDSWAPLHAWPETNEQKFSNPVIVPSGLHDDFTGEIGSGLAERNAEVLPRGDLPPNIVTVHGPEGNLYSHVLSDTPHQLVEDEYYNYFRKPLQTI